MIDDSSVMTLNMFSVEKSWSGITKSKLLDHNT